MDPFGSRRLVLYSWKIFSLCVVLLPQNIRGTLLLMFYRFTVLFTRTCRPTENTISTDMLEGDRLLPVSCESRITASTLANLLFRIYSRLPFLCVLLGGPGSIIGLLSHIPLPSQPAKTGDKYEHSARAMPREETLHEAHTSAGKAEDQPRMKVFKYAVCPREGHRNGLVTPTPPRTRRYQPHHAGSLHRTRRVVCDHPNSLVHSLPCASIWLLNFCLQLDLSV